MNRQKASSLVELILVIAAVGFMVMLIGNIPSSINLVGKAHHQGMAREIMSKKIEDLRSVPYANLANGSSAIADSRINLLPAGTGTILIEDCDPINICINGETAKQITVTVIWKDAGKSQTAQVKTLISPGGLNQ